MEEPAKDMSNKMDARVKGALLLVGAYVVAMGLAICFITVTITSLAETHSCSAMSRALVALGITIALVFLISVVVVGVVARKIIPNRAGCLAIVVACGVALLASYVVIIFGLMVAFNC